MRGSLPALLLLLASQAGAQGFVSMGRLFTTQDERARLDAARNLAQPAGSAAQGAGAHGAVPGLVGTGGAQSPGMDGSAGCAPGAAPGCPPAGAPAASGTVGGGRAEAEAAEAAAKEGLRLGGFIRRSTGQTTIILNGEAQAAPPGGVMRGTVTVQADGRSVVLKPGQRYDPATGEVHEAAR
ncbi:hypothetical protein [Duganella sp. CF458]|uniref:hypothetical protein n=1 Tax=Duganella sp. CF458 TaxID=1884368 RepID=UPI00147E55AE|nr:hypothetical protein [Duganella sp. CF458]